MDQVEIDLLDRQPLEAALELRLRVATGRGELRRQEDLLPRDPTRPEPSPDAGLVAVALSRVDVPVPHLERPFDGLLDLPALGDLEDPEPHRGHLEARTDLDPAAHRCSNRPVRLGTDPARIRPRGHRAGVGLCGRRSWSSSAPLVVVVVGAELVVVEIVFSLVVVGVVVAGTVVVAVVASSPPPARAMTAITRPMTSAATRPIASF